MDTEILFQNTTVFNKETFAKAADLLLKEPEYRKSQNKLRLIMLPIALIVTIIAIFESMGSTVLKASTVIFIVVAGVLIALSIRTRAFLKGMSLQKYKQNGEKTEFIVKESAISVKKPQETTTYYYKNLKKVLETDSIILLKFTNITLLIDKKGFAFGTEEEFLNFVRGVIK